MGIESVLAHFVRLSVERNAWTATAWTPCRKWRFRRCRPDTGKGAAPEKHNSRRTCDCWQAHSLWIRCLRFSQNSDETGFTALLLNFIKEQCDHPFVKKYYQYSNADDAIFSLETLNEHADLLELLIKTRPFRVHILRFAHGVHFCRTTSSRC